MATATKRQLSSPPAAAISEVLDDDDLLGEILLRLALPTSLVRATLVCARWLRVASGAAFLRRFRGLHPPPLLGFYADLSPLRLHSYPKFVPMPSLPPELAAAARTAGAALDAHAGSLRWASNKDCRDDRLIVYTGFGRSLVLFPLHPLRQAVVLSPPLPQISTNDKIYYLNEYTFGVGRGGADVCVTSVSRSSWQYQRTAVDVHEHGVDGAWHNLASMELELPLSAASHLPFIDGRIYLVASASAVVAMRLASRVPADVPIIALPDGLEDMYDGSYKMAVASDSSGLHLVRREGFQIHVLHHRIAGGAGAGSDDWSLVDTVCLRGVCASLGLELPSLAGDHGGVVVGATAVKVHAVGDDAEFVFLQVGKDVLYVHVKSRVAKKVYTVTVDDERFLRLVPLVMPWPWPPIFPAVECY